MSKAEVEGLQLSGDVQEESIKLDQHGMPLVPQPTDDPLDPLNWPSWLKFTTLIQVSLIACFGLLGAALITPAFVPLSKFLHKSLVGTAYVTSVFILFTGASPILLNPVANVYGRRPVYVFCTLLSVATAAGSGASKNYASLLTLRALNGVGGGAPGGLGSATVCDLYFQHERGLYMGIFTVFLTNGGHLAPIIGGFVEKNLSWHWCFYLPAILTGGLFLTLVFCLPETLYYRSREAVNCPRRTWRQNFLIQGKVHPTRKLRAVDFIRPFQMLVYPSVIIPALYYAVSFAFGSILFIISSANLFREVYEFEPYQTGLLLGIPLTVGTALGELVSGGFSDWVVYRYAKARGGHTIAEDRLMAIWPALIILPAGIIIEGVCIEKETHWIGPGLGIGIASFGLQIATTVIYAYTADCYKPQSAEIGAVLNAGRNFMSFPVAFYAVPLGERIGFQWAWVLFALLNVLFFSPMILLMFKGEKWRRSFKVVNFHNDL
ncbi:major facilitator superfamily domain-containing protein [Xylogone sp. PMI_703]|nr:major facilitator superfamily domain-containing protein [Xylogone sp. PMI_703]